MNDLFRNMLGTEPLNPGGSGTNPLLGIVITIQDKQLKLESLIAEGKLLNENRKLI